MAHFWELNSEQILEQFGKYIVELKLDVNHSFFKKVVAYFFSGPKITTEQLEKLVKQIPKQEADYMLSTIEEAKKEAHRETALRLLEKNIDIQVISDATGLSIAEIKLLQRPQ